MTSSSTLFRRILFSNIEKLVFNLINDKARDSCDCHCDDEIRNEIFDDRKKNTSIMIKMKKKLICEFDDF